MKKRLKIWALNWVCRNLLKAVVLDDVLTVDSKTNTLFLGKDLLTEGQRRQLRQEAKDFERTLLYSILMNTPANQARKIVFERSVSFDDIWSGKMMLYTIDLQEKIVQKLSTIK
jgi:hypothetical protein